MIIKELHLVNFGKFTDKKILLDDHMNIIYGENEAGKSTIFNFIVGMLFGFYKPYVKNRRLLEIHETYKPWSGGGYLGNMVIFDEESGDSLRIERNFDQKNESITVFNVETGEDITKLYPIHPVFRLPDIAGVHLGVSYTTFINTLAIKQLGHETDENLDKELEETVVNALSTRNIDVSVTKVQDKIAKELNEIGTNRKKTSNYYLKKEKRISLKEELGKVNELHRELLSLKKEEVRLSDSEQMIKDQLIELDMIKKAKLWLEASKLEEEANCLRREKEELEVEKDKLKVRGEFKSSELERTIDSIKQLDFQKQRLKERQVELASIKHEILELEKNRVQALEEIPEDQLEELTKDLYQYEQLEDSKKDRLSKISETKARLNDKRSEVEDGMLKRESLIEEKQRNSKVVVGGGVLLVLGVLLAISVNHLFYGLVLIGLAIVIIGGLKINSLKGESGAIEDRNSIKEEEINGLNREIDSLDNDLNQLVSEIEKIASKYEVEDYPSLTLKKDKWLRKNMEFSSIKQVVSHQQNLMEKLEGRKKDQEAYIEDISEIREAIEVEILPVTSYYQSESRDELLEIKENLQKYQELGKSILNLEQREKDILSKRSLKQIGEEKEALYLELENWFEIGANYETKESDLLNRIHEIAEDKGQLIEGEELVAKEENNIQQQLAGLRSKEESLLRGHRNKVEIEEEIQALEEEIKAMEFKKKVYENIRETIDEITDELKHNFAPLLNETVSSIVEKVTENKYSDVKINPEMFMRLVDPKTNRTIGAHQLSRGTVDLFYIALREALADWVNSEKKLPLLMDETFAHFDDRRLKVALELFSKQSRQILLFTCQQREVIIAGDSTNIVEL